jgi:hypothetical protein
MEADDAIPMIRIATPATFDAIVTTLPLRTVGCEPQLDAQGRRLIWRAGCRRPSDGDAWA